MIQDRCLGRQLTDRQTSKANAAYIATLEGTWYSLIESKEWAIVRGALGELANTPMGQPDS